MNKTPELLHKLADLFAERNAVYKDNVSVAGIILDALFPEGITLKGEEDHRRFHILALIVVKITRYAPNWNRGGHKDTTDDLAVYAAMLSAIDAEINDGKAKT